MKPVKKMLCLAIGAGLSIGGLGAASAAPVVSITLADVGSTAVGGGYSSVLDGISGAFRFANINDTLYTGASLFYGDVDAAPGTGMGVIDTTVANGHTTFTTGFLFAGAPFRPLTLGPIDMDISGMNMTITSLPFAGIYGADPNTGQTFVLPPQSSPPGDCTYTSGNAFEPLSVHWLQQIDANNYAFKIGWSHCITAEEDPIGSFVGFHAHWRVEGIATTAVPVPAAAWLFGSGLVGLVATARRRENIRSATQG